MPFTCCIICRNRWQIENTLQTPFEKLPGWHTVRKYNIYMAVTIVLSRCSGDAIYLIKMWKSSKLA